MPIRLQATSKPRPGAHVSIGLPVARFPDVERRAEVSPRTRLAYSTLADFIPGIEPYEFLTTVDLTPDDGRVTVVKTIESMHDDVWTQRLVAGRENELDNLAKVTAKRE